MDSHVEEQYLRELLLQADYALVSVQQANAVLEAGPQPLFFRELHAFLSHAAAISRLLWPPRDRGRPAGRAEHLRQVLGIGDGHALERRNLRDHLEHFDERLDTWAQETSHGAVIDMNVGPVALIVGGPAVGAGDFIRNFDPQTKIFTFRGDAFNVQQLVDAVGSVRVAAAQRVQRLSKLQSSVEDAAEAEGPSQNDTSE